MPSLRKYDRITAHQHRRMSEYSRDVFGLHRIYYAQFVQPRTVDQVVVALGSEAIAAVYEQDPLLGELTPLIRPLCIVKHDTAPALAFDADEADACGQRIDSTALLCIAKEAARIHVEQECSRRPGSSA